MDHIKVDNEDLAQNEIDIFRLFSIFWSYKLHIVGITAFFSLISLVAILFLPVKFTSSALLAPVDSNNFTNRIAAGYGGLAGLAGIDLGDQSISKTDLAIEILQSRSFFINIMEERSLLPALFATKGWNEEKDLLIYRENLYDQESDSWLNNKPFIKEMNEEWNKDILSISKDNKTNFITIKIRHYSPTFAYQLLNWVLEDLDAEVRNRDMASSTKAIEYLQQELKDTDTNELKSLFYSLIQEQTNKRMLAKTNPQYVFNIIDPPFVPEEKSDPKSFLIFISVSTLGFFTSLMFVLLINILRNRNRT